MFHSYKKVSQCLDDLIVILLMLLAGVFQHFFQNVFKLFSLQNEYFNFFNKLKILFRVSLNLKLL